LEFQPALGRTGPLINCSAREQKLAFSRQISYARGHVVKKTLQLDGESCGQAAPDGGPLRGRRLEKFGKVELLQIINDPPSYWFVMIRNFDPKPDLAPGRIDPAKSNVWRFLDFGRAKAKFRELSALPWCLADEQKRQELREKQKQRILAAGLPFPKKLKALDGVKIES
jgi:hypothetical protein